MVNTRVNIKIFLAALSFALIVLTGALGPALAEDAGTGKEMAAETVVVSEKETAAADEVSEAGETPEDSEEKLSHSDKEDSDDYDEEFYDEAFEDFDEEFKAIADPLEPFNRVMFVFNDKLYFWVMKPVAQGYSFVVPEPARVAVGRFFANIFTPIRLVNSVLQLKFRHAGTELTRFAINSTVGILGFTDPARDHWGIYTHEEDFGQTIGRYGSGPGFFITWPILGPSSARDTIGLVGDTFLNPFTYLFAAEPVAGMAVKGYEVVNTTSLNIGVYEDLKKDAIDPYTFLRDAYHQHRENLVKE